MKFIMILIEAVIFYAKSDVTLFAPNRNFMSPIILQTSVASSWLFKLSWPVGQATISSYCWCLPFPYPPILSNHLLGKSGSAGLTTHSKNRATWLKSEVRENLGYLRKSIQILTFLSPLPHVPLTFTKTMILKKGCN
jgi:hypothetical protein